MYHTLLVSGDIQILSFKSFLTSIMSSNMGKEFRVPLKYSDSLSVT